MSKLTKFLDRICFRRLATKYQLNLGWDHQTGDMLMRIDRALQQLKIMGTHDPHDVFVLGYPKSGHTWVQNLLACVCFGCDGRETPDAVVQHLIPDVHFALYYFPFASPMFFKSHHLPRPDYRKVIYLLRDGRDVMASYRYWLESVHAVEVGSYHELRRLSDFVAWHEHVETWLKNPYEAETLIVRYEDLKLDGARELRRICCFAGVDASDERIHAAVESCSFENLRYKEDTYGMLNKRWPKGRHFFRRGVIGSHRDELDERFLQDFLAEAEPTLRRLQYL
jgi:hypothetical protein